MRTRNLIILIFIINQKIIFALIFLSLKVKHKIIIKNKVFLKNYAKKSLKWILLKKTITTVLQKEKVLF
jgi:hypothetical protein